MTRLLGPVAALFCLLQFVIFIAFAAAFSLFYLVAYPAAELFDAANRVRRRIAIKRILK